MDYLTTLLLNLYSWEFFHKLYLVFSLKEFVFAICARTSCASLYIVNMHCYSVKSWFVAKLDA